jgi:hypothetical protein
LSDPVLPNACAARRDDWEMEPANVVKVFPLFAEGDVRQTIRILNGVAYRFVQRGVLPLNIIIDICRYLTPGSVQCISYELKR